MSNSRIVRLLQNEPAGNSILIHVSWEDQESLDVDLLATDGDNAFKGKIREKHLKKLRSSNYEGSDEEWAAILRFTFKSRTDLNDEQRQNLDVKCLVTGQEPKTMLTISFRNRIEDITQKLGSVELKQTTDTDDVDLFGWAVQLTEQRDDFENHVVNEAKKLEAATSLVASLQSQLTDLVKAKADHEVQLLSKFSLLLNEKKLKIRNQQRALATGKGDRQKIEALAKTLDAARQSPTTRRTQKRKVENDDDESISDEDDAFEKMDLDPKANAEVEVGSRRSTTRSTTPSTDSQIEEDTQQEATQSSQAESSRKTHSNKKQKPLPPPRTLPFQNTRGSGRTSKEPGKSKASPDPETVDDEETASEDEEL